MINCEQCGTKLSEGSLFCNKCGSKIISNEVELVNMHEEVAVSIQTDDSMVPKVKRRKLY